MKLCLLPALLGLVPCSLLAAEPPVPKFRALEIDRQIEIGYGLALADVDGDGKTDILLADKRQIVWYRNPGASGTWAKSVMAESLTPKDHVCIAAQDLDGDGKCEVAVGAEWNPSDTEKSGAVFYLVAPADRTQPWTPVKLHAEPTTHRMRWMKLSDGKWALVVAPLHGRANKAGQGTGVQLLAYRPPAALNDPQGEWKTELLEGSLHMTHNFEIVGPGQLLLGGREGIANVQQGSGVTWLTQNVEGAGPSLGAGEVRLGKLAGGVPFVAAVEPMHGPNLVVYAAPASKGLTEFKERRVLTDSLVEGHALACGNVLGGAHGDQIVVGWRGNPTKPDAKVGLGVWTALDPAGLQWRETRIDDGGIACEDLQLADLNGDGKLDIVAAGRWTKNVKIYFNESF